MLSIVIPAYNEAESLPDLLQSIHATVKKHGYVAEIICINDGSTDATAEVRNELVSAESAMTVHVIHFRRNRGKAEALTAGFQKAMGDIVITMDADLQDDPTEIPKLLDTLHHGNYDVVSGWKSPRNDPLEKRVLSFVFNRVTALLTGVKLHDMNCGLKAYRAEVVKGLHLYGDLNQYIPIWVHVEGFSIGEVKVKHYPRRFGKSKYGFRRIPKGFLDLLTVLFLTRYKKRPMHLFGGIGCLLTFTGVVLFIVPIVQRFFPFIAPQKMFFCVLGGLCSLTGCLFVAIGLFAELIIAFLTHEGKDEKTPPIFEVPSCRVCVYSYGSCCRTNTLSQSRKQEKSLLCATNTDNKG